MPALTACEPLRGADARLQTDPHADNHADNHAGAPVGAHLDSAPRRHWRVLRAAALSLLVLGTAAAQAHKSSDAYLFFDQQAERTQLRWDIALRDLDAALTLDADGNRALTWGELRSAWPRIDALALQSLRVPGCSFVVEGHALEQRNDGRYAVLQMSAPCQLTAQVTLRYSLFADIDPTHRGIVRHTVAGGAATVRMLVPAAMPALLDAAAAVSPTAAPTAAVAPAPSGETASAEAPRPVTRLPSPLPTASAESVSGSITAAVPTAAGAPADGHLPSFIREGVHHIVTGYDHLLFLLCLLLPAVLWRSPGPPARWQAVVGWRQALGPVAKTVTLFTLAHSVTLALAATGWVRLAPSVVEPAIAATIMLAAFDNLRPLLLRWRGALTFGFGLIHGFGFAGVLGELQLPAAQFGWALFQFNLGLELGQLALVFSVVPLLLLLRHRAAYVPWVLRAGSVAALLMAGLWLVERTADWTGLGA